MWFRMLHSQSNHFQDSSEGLARMYADLEPLARAVKSAACSLLIFSMLFCGTLEGLFGLFAACTVLFCAAPGSLGVAHASRCAKICAIFTASLALFHMMALSTFSIVVLPSMPATVAQMCMAKEREMASMAHKGLPAGKHPNAGTDFDLSDVLVAGKIFAEAKPELPTKTAAPSAKPLPIGREAVLVEGSYSNAAAQLVAGGSIHVARKLEQVVAVVTRVGTFKPAPLSAHCAKVSHFFADVAPMALLLAGLVELCLFLSAMNLARRAGHLVQVARSSGANGI